MSWSLPRSSPSRRSPKPPSRWRCSRTASRPWSGGSRNSCGRAELGEANMKLPRRTVLHLAAGAAALPMVSRLASAQAYPARPITMIVPYPAGGPTDTVGRTVAQHMRAELGQPVILENVTGAAGSIGLARVARAPADGYTINVGNWGAHVV